MAWQNQQQLPPKTFTCGYCDSTIGSDRGFVHQNPPLGHAYICPVCERPTFFRGPDRMPGAAFGESVGHLPADISTLYNEARGCCAHAAYTAAVLLSRKLLMNIAVSKGAPANQTFMQYVEWLSNNGYVPPDGKGWVDHIRKKGNEATHEIHLMQEDDAKDLVTFSEMLLKLVYEFPNRVPKKA